MKVVKTSPVYIEWLNAEMMHEESVKWLSELKFIKDEERFFEDLIKLFTLQLIDSKNFSKSKDTVKLLKALRLKNQELINAIIVHEKELKIMVDGKNQLKEEAAYKEEHRDLLILVKRYFKEYRKLKIQLFKTIKDIMKSEKQKRLLP
ncbi:hypothetical protein GCM10007962_22870 [Yeosuana aromativorans]|uniref:Uncharacterized protein n=1 Tax=Yeosuana aromativorans TaxID=288019 RepID=A0A8J3BQ61_9FLAO|nr:hypothetical protein [Yeosuana aromativorans]GGK28025.1 hypothetical protein GCM10007962_22870 [Yeosuana aromativorans]